MRIASWSSPRPRTSNVSAESVGRTSIETLPRTSLSRRALIWRLVTYLPSRPESGEVFAPKVMPQGRSVDVEARQRARIGRIGDACRRSSRPGMPATATMSPGPASSMSTRSMPWAVVRLVTVPVRVIVRPGSIEPSVSSASSRDDDDPLAHLDRPVPDPADGHPADVVVGRQVRHEQLERMVGRVCGRRGVLDQQLEERPQVGARVGQVHRGRAELGVRVDDREVDLRARRRRGP